jgi:hydrogenase nickel incorporation protein HypB
MCSTCGCNEPGNKFTIYSPDGKHHHHGDDNHHHSHDHDHHKNKDNDHHHEHDHEHGHHSHGHHHDHVHHEDRIHVETDILNQNNLLAQRNRGYFEAKKLLAINLMSSPGSGKTSLLEKTIADMKGRINICVIEGDQQTLNDAERIKKTGAPVIQINTGQGCHLDADMVNQAVKELDIADSSVLMIENVGNLVCPSLFDLGEAFRVVIMSVTEGEDKPLKYPTMFQSAQLCIINKTDLLPYLKFDLNKAKEYINQVNHHMDIMELSVYSGQGMQAWFNWIEKKRSKI